jgi:DNA-binding NarL/FixJ family response regulator
VIGVVLADDNAVIRQGVAAILETEDDIEVLGHADNGKEAIALARQERPDLVLLDIRMPVMDGIAAAQELAGEFPVLMLSYSEDEHLVTGAIRAGAVGYLVHGRFEGDELARAIRDAVAGETVISPAVASIVFDAVRRAPSGPAEDSDEGLADGTASLTAREREIMNLLAKGLSNKEISEQLFITHKTVKNHLHTVYGKLGVSSRAEATAAWLGMNRGP